MLERKLTVRAFLPLDIQLGCLLPYVALCVARPISSETIPDFSYRLDLKHRT
jgi:hypothetical protein